MQFTIQGRLTDDGGQPMQGAQEVVISLVSGIATIHLETVNGIMPDANGVFSHVLGSDTNNPLSPADLVAGDETKYLQFQVAGVSLEPRQPIVAVPFAFAAATVIGSDLHVDPDTGGVGVGIGTNAAAEQLEVAGAVVVSDTANPTPEAGTIRWSGTAFEGYTGTGWVPLSPPVPRVEIQMVDVGNEGNADDPSPNGLGGNSGAVAYAYKIGKFEVTNAEYAEFLNAVDPTGANALDLYDIAMGTTSNGGITFNAGDPAGGKYSVKPGFANKPVVWVSFYDAMRFCNWLHNGAQTGGDTEDGAYTLLGGTAIPSNGTTVPRNAGATFAVPSEDEWYKAAYYEPGGDTDDYWLYPTGSNSAPNASSPPGTAPAANYADSVGDPTDVGAYTTTVGFYGTFDMAGNAREWVERIVSTNRVLRGGSWTSSENGLQSVDPASGTPGGEFFNVGFRVSSP
jgi:formylglycine-generating enzyme required for sulfatase activity